MSLGTSTLRRPLPLGRLLRATAGVCAALVLALGLFTLRQVSDGEAEMRASDRAFNQDDLALATLHARRAATAFAPGAPHVDRAYRRLEAIATGAEATSRQAEATAAWRAMRSAALETRHLWVTMPRQLQQANDNLARLQVSAEQGDQEDRARRLERAQRELAANDAPDGRWLLALSLGFLLALAGLAGVGLRGVTPNGSLDRRGARWGALVSAVGVTLWAVAAWLA
ncbi:MAG: hypothetical protein R3B13_23690 [Polyangiaceae bacterium]